MKKHNEEKEETLPQQSDFKIYFYIAIAACVLSAAAFGLCFTFMCIYALISSIMLGLCSLAFCNAQKKKNNFKAVLYVRISAYCVTGIAALLFIGGLIYSAVV